MITKAQVKEIHALTTAKGRAEQHAFLAEGDKLAREWLQSNAKIVYVVALESWLDQNRALTEIHPEAKVIPVSEADLARVSSVQSPNAALVVSRIPPPPVRLPTTEWCLVLDTIQDPGNLGAIIRIADWFGIRHVVCSPGCADYYNPKVVGAAMGGHLRVQLHVTPLPGFLEACEMPVLAATLGGKPVNSVNRPAAAALIIGNESRGISQEVLRFTTQQVMIPRRGGAESLNAAVSAGILVAMLLPE
jgi:TrmH family RNA methyltransferase